MTDDHASAEPRPEQDHSQAKADNRTQGGLGRHLKKVVPTLLKGWRALAFLLIALIVGYYAFHYKALSDPGSESKQLASHAPQEIDFFVSNPNVSIDVNAFINAEEDVIGGLEGSALQPEPMPLSTRQVDHLSMTVHAPPNVTNFTILIIMNIPSKISFLYPQGPSFLRLENLPKGLKASLELEQKNIEGYSATAIPVKLETPVPKGLPIEIGYFRIGSDIEQTNAYLYGHLPAIGSVDQWASYLQLYPAVLAELYENAPDRIKDLVLAPPRDGPAISNPKSYPRPYGGPGELFWTPAKLSITETQSNLGLMMANQQMQINCMAPTCQPNGPDYVWQGSTYLDPVFQVTNNDALKGESDLAFRSGVFFGIAGAAAIAFFQEIPDTFPQAVWWSRRKRKRKSSSRNATGISDNYSEIVWLGGRLAGHTHAPPQDFRIHTTSATKEGATKRRKGIHVISPTRRG